MDPIYQLLSGNVAILLDGDVFFIASPDINIKHLAEIYSQQEYERAFSEGMMTQENAIELCIETGEWSPEEEELLSNKLPKNIEQMKLDYYKRFYITSSRKEIKNKIDELTKKINILYHKKMVYFSSTCEYIKKDFFDNYCIENCIFDENYKKIDSGIFNINTISKKYDEKRLSSKEIRDYSKNGKWRLIWSAAKENGTPFSNKDLNEDQLELISWTKMYDSIHQSMDCPPDEIIKDNIAIDGWFIEQDAKRKDESEKDKSESILKNSKSNGDIFIMAKNEKEVNDIIAMNDTQGKRTIQSLASDLKNRGSLKESELTHVKQNIQMAINSAK